MKREALLKYLRRQGCRFERQGGSHEVWEGKEGGFSVIPRHREIKSHTVAEICKQLKVPKPPGK